MLSVTESAVYGASMLAVPQLSLNSKIVGMLTLKRPEGRAPTSRQLVDALGGFGPHPNAEGNHYPPEPN